MNSCDNPIFIRGLSRSGGTLMVTLLDTHPDIAMAYEQYPNLLITDEPLDILLLADNIEKTSSLKKAVTISPNKQFGIFLIRCERGGLDNKDVANLLRTVSKEGFSFSNNEGRMRMIELCGLVKMEREEAKIWGMKCAGNFVDYLKIWPKARFINVLRDGRDVFASQFCEMGGVKKTPEQVAQGWLNTHQRFEKLQKQIGNHQAIVVRYEDLTNNPEVELKKICNMLNIEFDECMLYHHEQDLTLFNANHMSKKRVEKPIDTTKIGRWKKDLSEEQIKNFLSVAGEGLKYFGYNID